MHEKITCEIIALNAKTCFFRKIIYAMLLGPTLHKTITCTIFSHSLQSSQCCPNTSETTLRKKITGAMLAQTT